MIDDVSVVGAATLTAERHPGPETTTHALLARAFRAALTNAGIDVREVDGLGVASFSIAPDRAVDLAWKLGLRLRWTMDDVVGLNLVQHAAHAIRAGDASTVVIVAGDRLVGGDFADLAMNLNRTSRDYLGALPTGGPNALFALVTQAHMAAFGLRREDYGRVAVAQRAWAQLNPDAAYRNPLTMDDYLTAPAVADPLCLYDCVPLVAGAEAVVLTRSSTRRGHGVPVRLRSVATLVNHDHQEGTGLTTGVGELVASLQEESGMAPSEVDVVGVYDDYPVMVLVGLADLGLIVDGDASGRLTGPGHDVRPAINTSGGMLSAGQAGAGGSLHGFVECVRQLRGERGEGQVPGARAAVACTSTLALYRYGGCAAAAVLERAGT